MKAETKDELLQRDNRFDKVLGTMAGSIMDKESTPVQNAEVVQALKQFYDEDYTKHPHSFVEVSATSPDPEIREIYALLPAATKAEIIKIWGREAMMVRRDVMDINFGYRKISLADVFDIPVTDRTKVEHAFVRFTEYALAAYAGAFVNPKLRYQGKGQVNTQDYMKRAQMVVRRNERIWQEIVHEMKDIIVIKTGTVMIGNVLSNISLLMMNGVPFKDIVKHHRIAIKGAMAYQKDSDELASLKAQLDTGYTQGNAAEIKRQIIRLEDSLARNPVKGLIDAGLMPTIVEDVSTEEDIYSYKSKFTRTLDKYTSKLNSKVLDAGKTVYMTHDTKLYKSLSHVTQLSDFVARYTLYQHLTTKQDPLTAEEAVQESADSFVNYDIPMHRITQYMDDMGIMMFTKYFLRIQRVLLKLAREHPARVLGMVSLNSYFDLMPLVTESSALAHLGNNPLSTGAFGFPGALDELATVNAGLELFK
jgi:hypothetical protein